MADDKKTQLGTGTLSGGRSGSSPPPTGVVVTPISPSGSYSTPTPITPVPTMALGAGPASRPPSTPPSTPPLAAVPLATQPEPPPTGALAVPTNVPTASMAAAYNEDPLVGKTMVGRYHIAKKLGEGGMGSVYLASHIVLEKQVALKVLHGEYARKPDLVERFMQEAKAASRIHHENVIDISDFGVTEDGFVFFAMELLKGNDLHELVARARLDGNVLPWDRSRHIFLQICNALAAAHKHGIVHRDLKPENVYLIEFLGRPDFVKLLDFGIAKLSETDGSGEQRKLTRTGMLFGTPEYMSPEQARGDKVDHRVDIYAMACILFQLVTGRVPFEAENFMGVLSMHLTEPAPEIPLATLERCGAPPELAEIIARGLAKKPDERWQTIQDMANAIRALHGEALEGTGTFPPITQPPITQPPATQPPPPERVRTEWKGKLEIPGADARPGPGRSKLPFVIGGLVAAAGAAVAVVLVTRSPAPSAPAAPTAPTAPVGVAPPVEPPVSGDRTIETPTPPPTVPAPAPVPEKVNITFQLAKNATLYAPDGRKIAEGGRKGKEVILELAGSSDALEYKASFGKSKELIAFAVFPDRDGTVDISPEANRPDSGGGRSPTVRPGGTPTTNPGGTPAPSPGGTPTTNPGGTPTTNPGGTPTTNPTPAPVSGPDDIPDPDVIDLKGFDKDKEAKEKAKDEAAAPAGQ